MDQIFAKSRDAAEQIEGMLSVFSMAVMDSVLQFQRTQSIKGHVLEIGVFHGKSAAILAGRMSATERLILVDIAPYLERERMPRKLEFYCCPSAEFPRRCPDYDALRGSIRVAHIDASHAFKPTIQELAICDELISDDGIIVLDDFTNLNYSQNIAAIYKYLFTTDTDLMPVIVTDEKGYLCRRSHFHIYANYALEGIIGDLSERGIDPCIARTDVDREYMAYYVRSKMPGETDDRYGLSIYRHCYSKTSPLDESPLSRLFRRK